MRLFESSYIATKLMKIIIAFRSYHFNKSFANQRLCCNFKRADHDGSRSDDIGCDGGAGLPLQIRVDAVDMNQDMQILPMKYMWWLGT